mgnify:CR=1 FL=1|jgi:arylsulfatase A-like enzyme
MTSSDNKLNFLIVICDDLAFGDLSMHGNRVCRTPHLDGMGDAGISLGRHLAGPLCSPSRACLLTGRYNYRTRVVDTYCGRSVMDSTGTTLAQHLRQAGYATGCFGKWHLGDTHPHRPEDRGFDETLWHLGGGIGQPGDHPDNYGRESYFDPVLCRNGAFERIDGYCTDIFTNEALGFINRHHAEPWFAYVAFNAPHTPLQVDPEATAACAARGATGDLASLYAMVENIDSNVGRLLAALDAGGLRENTVVVFTSDHGPCPGVRDGEGQPRFNAGLRGEKGSVYEGGIRVPCLWSGPFPSAGGAFQEPTHAIDIVPTLLGMVGVEAPQDLDGASLLPLFRGNGLEPRTVFLQWHRGDKPAPRRNATAVSAHRKWVSISEGSTGELYDVANDPGESRNLASVDPEGLDQLVKAYDAWFLDVSRPHAFAPVPIVVSDKALPLRLTRQDWRVEGADGWDSRTKAHWVLDVRSPGVFNVALHFDEPPPARGTVSLECGGFSFAQESDPGRGDYEFLAELPSGETTLRARWQTDFSEGSPFAVEITRPLS